MLAVSTANTAEAYLLTKQIQGVKKIADLVGKKVKKTTNDTAKVVWDNKGAIAVGTIATVALTNPEATSAAITGTADVAYGIVTGSGTADTVVPRTSARQSNGGSVIPTVLFYLLLIGLAFIGARYLLHRIGIWRLAVPLLMVGVILLCAGVADAASPVALAPAVKPLTQIAMWVITAVTIFL